MNPRWKKHPAPVDRLRAEAVADAEARRLCDPGDPDGAVVGARMRPGRDADDPTYCCETGELLTELTGRVRRLEEEVLEISAELAGRRGSAA